MGRLYTYYWHGFMDNVWNVESIAFWGGKPKQSMAIANTIFALISWKARAVYGRSEHNLWTYILKRWKAKAVFCRSEHNPWTYILKY